VFDRAWWHLAYASDGSLIGFTQPVLFRDVLNGPMIRAFERAGYRRGRIRDVAFHD
jgi:hypothetical protein